MNVPRSPEVMSQEVGDALEAAITTVQVADRQEFAEVCAIGALYLAIKAALLMELTLPEVGRQLLDALEQQEDERGQEA